LNKTLTISLYNRPIYTNTLLDALNYCHGIDDYEIDIFCDPGSEEVIRIAKSFRPVQTEVFVNPVRYGCNSNIYQCLANGFKKNDYHIHLEDDTIPGRDCLLYFEWARKFKNDKNIFTVSGYVNSNNKTEHFIPLNDIINGVSRRAWFTPWGWATWNDRWEEMKASWDLSGEMGSWDTKINQVLRKDRSELIPTISRIQNIGGELGTHVPSNEWHKTHHYNEYWIESLNEYPETYEEI